MMSDRRQGELLFEVARYWYVLYYIDLFPEERPYAPDEFTKKWVEFTSRHASWTDLSIKMKRLGWLN